MKHTEELVVRQEHKKNVASNHHHYTPPLTSKSPSQIFIEANSYAAETSNHFVFVVYVFS